MKRLAMTLCAGAVVLAPAFAATPAHADKIYHRMTNSGGWLQFWPNGDSVKVCDTKADGKRAVVYVTNWTKKRFEYKIEAVGKSDCRLVGARNGQPYELAENHCFQFVLELYDKDHGRFSERKQAFWKNTNKSIKKCA